MALLMDQDTFMAFYKATMLGYSKNFPKLRSTVDGTSRTCEF